MASRLDKLLALGLILANEPICVEAALDGEIYDLLGLSGDKKVLAEATKGLKNNFPWDGFHAESKVSSNYGNLATEKQAEALVKVVLEFLEEDYKTVKKVKTAYSYDVTATTDGKKLDGILNGLLSAVEGQRETLTGEKKPEKTAAGAWSTATDKPHERIVDVRSGLLKNNNKNGLVDQFVSVAQPLSKDTTNYTVEKVVYEGKTIALESTKIEKLRIWLANQLQTAKDQHEQLVGKFDEITFEATTGSTQKEKFGAANKPERFRIAVVRESLFSKLKTNGMWDWSTKFGGSLKWEHADGKTEYAGAKLADMLTLVKDEYVKQCLGLPVKVAPTADAYSSIIVMRNFLRDKETSLHEKYTEYLKVQPTGSALKVQPRGSIDQLPRERIQSIQTELVKALKAVATKIGYSSTLPDVIEDIQRAILKHRIDEITASEVPTTRIAKLKELDGSTDVLQFHPEGHAMVVEAVAQQTNLQQQQQQKEANLQQQQQQKEAAKAEEEAAIGVGVGIGFGVTAVAAFIGLLAGFFCCKDEVSTGANVATEAGKNSGKFKNKMLNGQAARSRTSNAGQVDVPITGYFATTAEGATAERQQDAMAVVGTVGDIAAIAAGVFLLSGALLVWCRRRARGSRRDNFAGQQTRPSFAPGQRRPNFVRQRQQVW